MILDPALWLAAVDEQEKRRIRDTWKDVIENMPPAVEVRKGYSRKKSKSSTSLTARKLVRGADVLEYVYACQLDTNTQTTGKTAQAMERFGLANRSLPHLGQTSTVGIGETRQRRRLPEERQEVG